MFDFPIFFFFPPTGSFKWSPPFFCGGLTCHNKPRTLIALIFPVPLFFFLLGGGNFLTFLTFVLLVSIRFPILHCTPDRLIYLVFFEYGGQPFLPTSSSMVRVEIVPPCFWSLSYSPGPPPVPPPFFFSTFHPERVYVMIWIPLFYQIKPLVSFPITYFPFCFFPDPMVPTTFRCFLLDLIVVSGFFCGLSCLSFPFLSTLFFDFYPIARAAFFGMITSGSCAHLLHLVSGILVPCSAIPVFFLK